MKNRTIFLFLSVIVIGLLLAGCTKYNPNTSSLAGGGIDTLGTMVQDVVGGLFNAISQNPFIWLKLFLFIIIFATLYSVLTKLDSVEEYLDNKAIGILSFVLALAVAAISPDAWIMNLVAAYGGIIFAALYLILPGIMAYITYEKVYKDDERSKTLFWWILTFIMWIAGLTIWSQTQQALTTTLAMPGAAAMTQLVDFSQTTAGYLIIIGLIYSVIMMWKCGFIKQAQQGTHARTRRQEAGATLRGREQDITARTYNITTPYNETITHIATGLAATGRTAVADMQTAANAALTIVQGTLENAMENRRTAVQQLKQSFNLHHGDATEAQITALETNRDRASGQLGSAIVNLQDASSGTTVANIRRNLTTARTHLVNFRREMNTLDIDINSVERLLV